MPDLDLAQIIDQPTSGARWRTGKVMSLNPFTVTIHGDAAATTWMPRLVSGLVVGDVVMVLTDSAGFSVLVGKALTPANRPETIIE